jgi:hypothetical protein
LYEIREKISFFNYCVKTIGDTNEWMSVRAITDAYLAGKPREGKRIGNTSVYMMSLEMANCDYCYYYGVTDSPGMITLLELHDNK